MNLEMFQAFAKGPEKENKKNNEVLIYTRVSSKNQHDSNNSIGVQLQNARKFAERKGYNVTMEFGGTYESASGNFTRKEFSNLIDTVKRSRRKPYAILINTISRFSRSGGDAVGLAAQIVEQMGVHLIEVSTGRTTETEDGKLEIYHGLLSAKQENIDRLRITIPGMKHHLSNGFHLGSSPRGYDHYGPRAKGKYSPTQKITLNEEGHKLRLAWKWKLQGEKDFIILQKLRDLGMKKISKQLLSRMWRNPFYCGVSVHKMLEGNVVEGKWDKMVSKEDFLTVNHMLTQNTFGYKQEKGNPQRPLMGFISCSRCDKKMTGYEVKSKGVHYYKCGDKTCKGACINANTTPRAKGEGANQLFEQLLKSYTLDCTFENLFKKQLKLSYESFNGEVENELLLSHKELGKLKTQLGDINRRYLSDPYVDKDTYLETKQDLESKIANLQRKIDGEGTEISNLDTYIEFSVEIAQNLHKYWVSADLETKQRIQELVFTDGLSIDVSKREYLTKNVNAIFELIPLLPSNGQKKNEKRQQEILLPSSDVASMMKKSNHLIKDLKSIFNFYLYLKGKNMSDEI